MNARAHRLRVFEVVKETADAVTLVFDVPDDLGERFTYQPGQFLTIEVPSDRTGSVARCYSLSSSPHCDSRPAVTVKRTAGGYASNWICDNVAIDSALTVLEPSGVFVVPSLDSDVVLCAAGSGITPIISIATSMLRAGSGQVRLFYANRDADSIIFDRRIRELTQEFGSRFSVTHWLEDDRGLPTAEDLTAFLSPHPQSDVYLCGPIGFAEVVKAAAAVTGVARVHSEEYRSLDSNPFAESTVTEPGATTARGGGGPVVRVEFEGRTYEFDWPADKPLLDLLLDAGLDVPYVCRESACGTCVCSVRSGRTRMILNESLLDDEVDSGLTLACQTLPESDEVHIAFDQ